MQVALEGNGQQELEYKGGRLGWVPSPSSVVHGVTKMGGWRACIVRLPNMSIALHSLPGSSFVRTAVSGGGSISGADV
jgi:hypothetical protein